MISEKYKDSHQDELKRFSDRLEDEVSIQNALKGLRGNGPTNSTNGSGDAPRTTASPEWMGEFPWNWRKRMQANCIPLADFETANTFLVSVDHYVETFSGVRHIQRNKS